jgi:hypothetical protein
MLFGKLLILQEAHLTAHKANKRWFLGGPMSDLRQLWYWTGDKKAAEWHLRSWIDMARSSSIKVKDCQPLFGFLLCCLCWNDKKDSGCKE